MAERAARTIDERFDEVTQAFLDQRDFTTFVHDKLRDEIRQSEARLSRRLDRHELLLGEILTEVKSITRSTPTGRRR